MKPSSLIVETAGGPEALEDRPSTPRQVWNRIPDEVRERIVDLALEARNRTDELEPPQNDVVNCRKAFDDGNQNNSIAI